MAVRWRAFVNRGRGTDRAERAAHVVALSYERLWAQATQLGAEQARSSLRRPSS